MVRKNDRYYLAIGLGQYIVEGHTKIEATKEFSTNLSSIDRCIEVIHNRNDELYQKVKKQLRQNMNISNSTSI